jgi:hypothetical protein
MTKLTNPGITLFACHVIGLNAMVQLHAMPATLSNILVKNGLEEMRVFFDLEPLWLT